MSRWRWVVAWAVPLVFAWTALPFGDMADAAPSREQARLREPTAAAAAPGERAPSSAARGRRADELLAGFDPRRRTLVAGQLSAPVARGARAVVTLDPALDSFLEKLLQRNEVPYAGVVAIEPQTGKLLAYVSHSSAEPNGPDRVLDASAPAASVFKLVTATALLQAGVSPSHTTCYHGGSRALSAGELRDDPKLDTACASLAGALGFSINAVFAKLAVKHLDPKQLVRQASAYGFGERLPFDVRTEQSALDVPSERLEFARTAAGFWHVHMSPLHAAAIAASIANRGRMMRPELVERVVDEQGRVLFASEPALHRKVTDPRIAEQLATMMRATVAQGTSRRSFHDGRGRPLLGGIAVAGKTGTLSSERPYRGYSWWVGFAPVEEPKIALAVLLVNGPSWRLKAGQVASEALRHYLVDRPRRSGAGRLAER